MDSCFVGMEREISTPYKTLLLLTPWLRQVIRRFWLELSASKHCFFVASSDSTAAWPTLDSFSARLWLLVASRDLFVGLTIIYSSMRMPALALVRFLGGVRLAGVVYRDDVAYVTSSCAANDLLSL